ncbi:MAG: YceI family protein [Pseudomonadales bacterium]|nr:YceI family protein [Pseudomonadales bacterium]
MSANAALIDGELTMRGVTRPVTLEADFSDPAWQDKP